MPTPAGVCPPAVLSCPCKGQISGPVGDSPGTPAGHQPGKNFCPEVTNPLAKPGKMEQNGFMQDSQDLNALFAWLENQTSTAIAENLYHMLYEGGLTDAEKEYVYAIASRKTRNNSKLGDDDILTNEFMDMYAEYRSMGLNSNDAAALLGISNQRMKNLLLGGGITDKRRHAALLQIERASDINLKKTCLATIVKATENGNTKTAMKILESKWSTEWGNKEPSVQNNVIVATDDYAKKAQEAAARLKELRRKRSEADY